MATVVASASMSRDGFIARPDGLPGPLFDWYSAGDVPFETADPAVGFLVGAGTVDVLRDRWDRMAAIVVGRNQFEVAHGWAGGHPFGVPVHVVAHQVPTGWPREDTPDLTFVTGGVASAMDGALGHAGDDELVGVGPGQVACEALALGLVDELHIDLVPVLLGEGVPMFAGLADVPVLLAGPTSVVEGERVTHLVYATR